MADENLESFEELTGEDAGADNAGDADFGSNLEDIFNTGDDDAGDGMDAFGGGGDEAGSSLDTFFEDLSTIDDLEVLQADDEEEAPPPDDSEIEVGGTAVVAAAAEEAEPEKPKKEKKQKKPGAIKRWIKRGMMLAAAIVIGYFVWSVFIPNFSTYFETAKEWIAVGMQYLEGEKKPEAPPAMKEDEEKLADTEPPLPPVTPEKEKTAPRAQTAVAKPPPPPKQTGPWSIQVATCFFPSCLDGFRNYLAANKRSVILQAKTSQSHSLEIFSISRFNVLENAQQIADRVNKGNPMEGHAYTYRENGAFRISMGAFQDLARAKVVKNALNRQFAGEIVFSTRAKIFPYQVQSVMTGKYPNRKVASRALARLKDRHPRFQDAFVVKRQVK